MRRSAEKFITWLTLTNLQQLCLYGMLFTICLFRLGREIMGGSAMLAPVKLFFAVGLLLWIANAIITRDGATVLRLFREEANILFIVFLGVSLFSIVNARYSGAMTATDVFERVKLYSSFLLVVGIVKDRRILRIAILLLILGSVLTVLVGLYELAWGKAFFKYTPRMGIASTHANVGLAQIGGARVQGLSSDPGLHAYVMVVVMGLALPWVFYARRRLTKILAFVFLLACLANLIGTGTRSTWVAWLVAFAVFVLFLRHRYKFLIVCGCAAAGVLLFLVLALFPHIPTFERLNFSESPSWGWRTDTYYEALQMMKDHPLLGIGTGNYLYEYHNYLTDRPQLSRYFYGWLHNSYLQVLTENGVVGILLYLSLMLSITLGVINSYMRTADREIQGAALGLLLALTGHAVAFAAMPILYQELGGILMGLCVACGYVARNDASGATPLTPGGRAG